MWIDTKSGEEGLVTVEEFERFPEEQGRSELVRGRIVREPPAGFGHGDLASRIDYRLRRIVEERALGKVVTAETGFVLSEDPPTVRVPDVAFVTAERVPSERLTGFAPFAPDLAVEIMSPSNTVSEIQEKVLEYLDAGTRLVWVVDPATDTITVWHSRGDIRLLGREDELQGGDVLPGFRLSVAEVFG